MKQDSYYKDKIVSPLPDLYNGKYLHLEKQFHIEMGFGLLS